MNGGHFHPPFESCEAEIEPGKFCFNPVTLQSENGSSYKTWSEDHGSMIFEACPITLLTQVDFRAFEHAVIYAADKRLVSMKSSEDILFTSAIVAANMKRQALLETATEIISWLSPI